MSADRIFCFAPQYSDVVKFMHDMEAIVSRRSPHAIRDEHDLHGLDHITFIVIDGHPNPVPQRMWETIVERGAIVIHVDDQFDRTRRLAVQHHQRPRENSDNHGILSSPEPGVES